MTTASQQQKRIWRRNSGDVGSGAGDSGPCGAGPGGSGPDDSGAQDAPQPIGFLHPKFSWATLPDRGFYGLSFIMVVLVGLLTLSVLAVLIIESWPSWRQFGVGFLWSSRWSPTKEQFGALPQLIGSMLTSVIALILVVPFSIGAAMALNLLVPSWLKFPLSLTIQLLAGIPSIIYGFWGLYLLAPWLEQVIYPVLLALGAEESAGFIFAPIFAHIFAAPGSGISLLTAAIVLAIMVLPYIIAVMLEAFDAVPPALRESAYGLGATTSEVFWHVILPSARQGVLGGIFLGFGRALGETMAVTFVIGNAHRLPQSLIGPGTSIPASLANEFNEASSPLYLSSLVALGLILYGLTLLLFVLARKLLLSEEGSAKPATAKGKS
ncbi:MAG: phosphate ABC transporter permease subunit PstC [Candidatus Symbiobacter sp.]|nr:phosphate ABC transporter permease subunit PstC [Candidatus Symbiobacter sp.]